MIYYTLILDLEKAAIHCTFGTSTIQLSDKVGWTLQAPTLPMMAHWHRVRPDLMSVSISGQALEYVAMCGRGQRGAKVASFESSASQEGDCITKKYVPCICRRCGARNRSRATRLLSPVSDDVTVK